MPDIMELLNQLKFKRALGLPVDPEPDPLLNPEPEIDPSLYEDPASLDAYRQHIANVPTRQSTMPGGTDRALAALSGFIQQRQNPNVNQFDATQKILNRPYEDAIQDYSLEGQGLRESVGAEESSLNRRRLYEGAKESRQDKRDANTAAREDRELERGRQSEQFNITADDRDADRAQRKADEEARGIDRDADRGQRAQAARDSGDLKTVLAALAGNKDEKGWQIKEDAEGGFQRINSIDGRVEPVKGARAKIPATENTRRGNLQSMHDSIKRIKEISATKSSQIGPLDSVWEGLKTATTGTDPEMREIKRTTDSLGDTLLRLKSGAQINEKEYARLRKLVPDTSSPFATFQQDLELFNQELELVLKNTIPGNSSGKGKGTVLKVGGYSGTVEEE